MMKVMEEEQLCAQLVLKAEAFQAKVKKLHQKEALKGSRGRQYAPTIDYTIEGVGAGEEVFSIFLGFITSLIFKEQRIALQLRSWPMCSRQM